MFGNDGRWLERRIEKRKGKKRLLPKIISRNEIIFVAETFSEVM